MLAQSPAPKLWKKLYSYRSALAHGRSVDFKGDFAQLDSHAQVVEFLYDFTCSLVMYALQEPRLISDLREC